ncbi:MAG: hypothetical protein WAK01_05060 [Methylocystis sp.]
MNRTTQALLPLSRCEELCDLTPQEMIIGARPRPEHEELKARYRQGSSIAKATLRAGIVAAIRTALDSRQERLAAELLVALRVMLAGDRRHAGVARQGRRASSRYRRPINNFNETRGEGLVSAIVVNLAERRANLASNCATA